MRVVSRKTARLTVDHLAELPDEVRSCLFWELSPVDRARLDEQERIAEKENWLSSVLRDWGSCGRVVRVDGQTVGFIVYAPAARLPGAATLPTAPTSPDAIVAATAWIEPRHRGGGLGRLLVQAMAADLVQRGQTAIEAYGDTRGRTRGCVLPAEFLGSVGFKTQRPPDDAADADGAAHGAELEGRGRARAGADVGSRTPRAQGDPPDRIGAGRLGGLASAFGGRGAPFEARRWRSSHLTNRQRASKLR